MMSTDIITQLPVVGIFLILVMFVLKHTKEQAIRHDEAMERKDILFSNTLKEISAEMTQTLNQTKLEVQMFSQLVKQWRDHRE